MPTPSISNTLFKKNRQRLAELLFSHSLAVVHANDILPTNADGTLRMHASADLFYLTGIEQEESILVMAPDAFDPKQREILFLREPNEHLKVWEGHKHSKEEAQKISGVREIRWLSEFPTVLHQLMCEMEHVYLNTNEHKRAVVEVESRDARFIQWCRQKYPLHDYRRLARLMHTLRVVKSDEEVQLIQHACQITKKGFLRALRKTKPGRNECEIEAEYIHEFTKHQARFAYSPIIGAGANSCVLHYLENNQTCRNGEVLLLDVGACYRNYNADLTRTIPVSGKFTRRQKDVYRSVLRVLRAMIDATVPGKLHRDWQKEAEALVTEELLRLKLLKPSEVKKQNPDRPACKKYFMHGLGHPMGLDVHDVGFATEPFAPGWVMTVEPGIYIPEEGFGIRLENDILVTEGKPIDLMADIPVEPDEIESLMNR